MKEIFQQAPFYIVIQATICLSVVALFGAIILDFALFSRKEGVKKEQKSIVETGTMTLFFLLYYIILQSRLGTIIIYNETIRRILMLTGAVAIITGCIINIRGRFHLGSNWANHIKIYKDHTLIQVGMFKLVRHPLYSSIMLMFFGGSLVFMNILALLSVWIIFIPFMYYRAKQEEKLLEQSFPEYNDYRKRTGMFFPRIFTRRR